MEPIEKFELCAYAVLEKLYLEFPHTLRLEPLEVVSNDLLNRLAGENEEVGAEEEFANMTMMRPTITWLLEEGFIKGQVPPDGREAEGLYNATLSAKGLALVAKPFETPLEDGHDEDPPKTSLIDFFEDTGRKAANEVVVETIKSGWKSLLTLMIQMA